MSSETKVWCSRAIPVLRETLLVEPSKQAAKSAASNEFRYLEWYGFMSAVLGIKSQSCVREAHLSRPFEGTSDALCSEEHRKLYEKTYKYAETFNQHMSVERKKRGFPTCDDAS